MAARLEDRGMVRSPIDVISTSHRISVRICVVEKQLEPLGRRFGQIP
jgi:hypothetical protein